jgi:hypothetical protein
MSNMSYCRFENTYRDLLDCFEALDEIGLVEYEKEANEHEKRYIKKIFELCEKFKELKN